MSGARARVELLALARARVELLALACLELYASTPSTSSPPSTPSTPSTPDKELGDGLVAAFTRTFGAPPACPPRVLRLAGDISPRLLGLPTAAGPPHEAASQDVEQVARALAEGLPGELLDFVRHAPIRRVALPPLLPEGARRLDLPCTPHDVSLCVGEALDALNWLADPQGRLARAPLERGHYRYEWVSKRRGGKRLLEIPRARLRATQRTLLREVLDRIPPHPAATGFRPGVGFAEHAARHAGARVVVRLDLRDFFPSVRRGQVKRALMRAGLPRPTAALLADLTTHTTHAGALGPELSGAARARYASPHLPQGAPTSPALANLVASRLDARLTGLASRLGASYSRYADDLVLSGGAHLKRDATRLVGLVGAIVHECGFELNFRKTRVMASSQRQSLGGVVVNARPTLSRQELKRLEATLYNCVQTGPSAQNRARHPDFRAHLQGRVAWVRQLCPARAHPLEALLAQVTW